MNDELLKKLAVTLDSETAKQVAEQYIRFKYFDLLSSVALGIFLLAFMFYMVYRMTRDR